MSYELEPGTGEPEANPQVTVETKGYLAEKYIIKPRILHNLADFFMSLVESLDFIGDFKETFEQKKQKGENLKTKRW